MSDASDSTISSICIWCNHCKHKTWDKIKPYLGRRVESAIAIQNQLVNISQIYSTKISYYNLRLQICAHNIKDVGTITLHCSLNLPNASSLCCLFIIFIVHALLRSIIASLCRACTRAVNKSHVVSNLLG